MYLQGQMYVSTLKNTFQNSVSSLLSLNAQSTLKNISTKQLSYTCDPSSVANNREKKNLSVSAD